MTLKNEILGRTDNGLDIFKHLLGDEAVEKASKPGKSICNPLRDDNTPSFSLHNKNGEWKATDFGNEQFSGSAFDLWMLQYNITDFGDACRDIAQKFNILVMIQTSEATAHQPSKPKPPTTIYPNEEDAVQLNDLSSPLHTWFREKGVSEGHLGKWKIGTSRRDPSKTVFGLLDTRGKLLNLKYMRFKADGHRVKEGRGNVHHQTGANSGQSYSKAAYGTHLVRSGLPFIIVEAETTASFAAWHYPDYNWLATGSAQGANFDQHIAPLLQTESVGGKPTVVYLADNDKAGQENQMVKALERLQPLNPRIKILNPFPEQRKGYDLRDALEEGQLQPSGNLFQDLGIDFSKSDIPHKQVFEELLAKVQEVDFRELARENTNLSEEDDLKGKHYIVCCIDHLLTLAKENHWGICKRNESLYLYNGAYWALINVDDLMRFLSEAAQRMGIDYFDAGRVDFVERLLKQFMFAAHLPEPDPDPDKVLINLQNGTFAINSQGHELKEFDRNDFLTYQLPFAYDKDAKAPLFDKYLNRVQPDLERQHLLAEYLGYIFTRNMKLEKTLLLTGSGGNGKGVFFEIVNAMLGGKNVTHCSLEDLTGSRGEYYRADIANSLVNYCSDISARLETAIFKQLVSGEPVTARYPYGKAFTLTRYAKLLFNTNELPRDVEQTNAYFRRFLIVPFDVTITQGEKDPNLHRKIIADELPGVFNWMLKGLERLRKQGDFSRCEASEQALERYKIDSDSVRLFLEDEGYRSSTNHKLKRKPLYADYRTWCLNEGNQPVKSQNFFKRIQAAGIVAENDKNEGWVLYLEK